MGTSLGSSVGSSVGSSLATPDAGPWLVVALFLLSEYGVKQWLESHPHLMDQRPWVVYLVLRAVHLGLNIAMIELLYDVGWSMLILVYTMELCAAGEIVVAALDRSARRLAGVRVRWAQILPMLAATAFPFVVSARLTPSPWLLDVASARGASLDSLGVWVLAYAFLAYPANHVVRCLIDKRTDLHVVDTLFVKATAKSPEARPTRPPNEEQPVRQAVETGEFAVETGEFAATEEENTAQISAAHTSEQATVAPSDPVAASTLRAGRTIGILERWIVVTLTVIGQFGLIGLVLAAKSVARFKRLEQEEFAEYYLLGTLYSLLMALVVGVALAHV